MTPLGYIMVLAGMVCLIVSNAWLYRLFIFFSLFSATSIANFGDGDTGSAVQAWMWFGSLWLLRSLVARLPWLPLSADPRIGRQCNYLLLFVLVAFASLAMPIYIDGRLDIVDYNNVSPLFFSWHNITQFLYLVFGIAIAILVAHENLREDRRRETERILLLSAGFIAVWGLLQFACNALGVPYPAFLLNNSESASGKGYLETMNEVGRISSATVEPSMLAQGLLSILPLTLPAFLRKRPLFSVRTDKMLFMLMVVVLVLSTSSTAYVGFLIYGAVTIFMLVRMGMLSRTKAWKLTVGLIVTIGITLGLAVLFVPIVGDIVNSALLHKVTDSSGLERAVAIAAAFGYFQQYPILGVGWGSAVSHDMIVKLLSNVGLVGTVCFLGAVLSIVRQTLRSVGPLNADARISPIVWSLSILVYVLTSVLITFPLAFGNFWITLGMAISVGWRPVQDRMRVAARLAVEQFPSGKREDARTPRDVRRSVSARLSRWHDLA